MRTAEWIWGEPEVTVLPETGKEVLSAGGHTVSHATRTLKRRLLAPGWGTSSQRGHSIKVPPSGVAALPLQLPVLLLPSRFLCARVRWPERTVRGSLKTQAVE